MTNIPAPTCPNVRRLVKNLCEDIIDLIEREDAHRVTSATSDWIYAIGEQTFEAIRDEATLPLREALDDTLYSNRAYEEEVATLKDRIRELEEELRHANSYLQV